MKSTPTIVLLGGSGLAPWAWERVTPILEEHGFRVLTPRLRATGHDSTPAAEVSLQDWTDDLFDVLTELDADDTVLVAHSFAGYVAAAALERDPRIVRTSVLLDGALPSPCRSWFDVMGPQVETFMASIAENGAIPFFTREQLDQVYPGHGISDDDWAWMEVNITAQPIRTYAQPATTRAVDAYKTQLAYVCCLRTSPPVAEINASTPGWTFRTLPTGHWPMITDPAATVTVIKELASL